jgi:flagellin-specific chaperone FliS
MISRWTQHLKNEEDKEKFRDYLSRNKELFSRLRAILDEEEEEISRSERTQKEYEISNWAYLQAHKNGYRQCLALLKKLTILDPKEPHDPIDTRLQRT